MAWIRVGDIMVADDATVQGLIEDLSSLTRLALDSVIAGSLPLASDTRPGLAEYATLAETNVGTASNRIVTPEGLKYTLDAQRPFRVHAVRAVIGVRNDSGGMGTFNYPSGTFTGTPRLAVTRATAQAANWVPYVVTSSSTSATIGIYNTAGTSSYLDIPVDVLSVQML